MSTSHKIFSKWDLLLIISVIGAVMIWIGIKQFSPNASEAVILIDGKIYEVLQLNKSGYYKI